MLGFRETERDWDSFCDTIDGEPGVCESFELAASVLHGEISAPWRPHEVASAQSYDLDIIRSFIGVPRAAFQQLAGQSPSEMNVAECDLPNELGQHYKGVLMIDPGAPFMRYELRQSLSLKNREFLVQPASDIRCELAAAVFQNARSDRDHESVFTKMRNCTLTSQQLDAKLGQVVFGRLGAAGGRQQPAPEARSSSGAHTSAAGFAVPSLVETPAGAGPVSPPPKAGLVDSSTPTAAGDSAASLPRGSGQASVSGVPQSEVGFSLLRLGSMLQDGCSEVSPGRRSFGAPGTSLEARVG